MNHAAKVVKRLCHFHILTVHMDRLNGLVQDVTVVTDVNAWTLVLIQETRNRSGSASPVSDSSASGRTSVVSVNITPSCGKPRSLIRTVPNDTPEAEFSDTLHSTWSMQVLKINEARTHP